MKASVLFCFLSAVSLSLCGCLNPHISSMGASQMIVAHQPRLAVNGENSAMNLSVAPTWFNISNSCLCNIAILRDIYDIHMPIDTNINISINVVIDTNFQPALTEVFIADVCVKNFARFEIFSRM